MFCTSCGRALPDGTAHCPDCGAEAKPIDYCGGFAGITEPPKPEPQPKDDRRERRLLGVIIALSILLLLSAAGTLFLLGRDAPADSPAQTETTQRAALTQSGANP